MLKLQSPAPRPNLIGLSRAELAAHLHAIGTPADRIQLRVKQLWRWIYVRGCRDFLQMEDIVGAYRRRLDASFSLIMPSLVSRQASVEGTRKYLFRVGGGHEIETVYIPEAGRGTVCVSSQVGCTLNCSFCHSGTQALVRNLNAAEIVGQLMAVRDDFKEWHSTPGMPKLEERLVSNVVFMGMGEPLYNFESVRRAALIMMDGEGIGLSRRRITVSTAGVVPQIHRVGAEIGCRLAVSLHATTDQLRNRLVPINRKWNIEMLLDALRTHPSLSNADRILIEYVMLRDVNDSDRDAHRLASLLRGIPAKVNLIPFNKWPGSGFERSPHSRVARFADIVHKAGFSAPIRTPRGEDIMAACGQLKSATVRERRRRSRSCGDSRRTTGAIDAKAGIPGPANPG
ncbi:MAG: 23S rRNA (adenine(2503)-C(2))-methyltransferase RlmN [Rhodobacteraceae bacterium]|nr:23S rRNA (adenine(2503)-C(2))-methyltransferase RlmN [Paracoccaceae bacterium]